MNLQMPEMVVIAVVLVAAVLVAVSVIVALRMRARVEGLERSLDETRLELAGANNRLEQARAKAALLSNTDPLTGVLARHVVVERFQMALALARRQDAIFGIVLLQLIGFDTLAERQGRDIADRLLTMAGDRLRAATREMDTVGRVRDYEFAVLLPALKDARDAEGIASKLRVELETTLPSPDAVQPVRLVVNVGSATYPRDGADWNAILKTAEESLRVNRIQIQ